MSTHYDLECQAYEEKTGKDPHALREPDHPDHRVLAYSTTPIDPTPHFSIYHHFLSLTGWSNLLKPTTSIDIPSKPLHTNLNKSRVGELEGERVGEEDFFRLKWVWV